MPGKYSTMGSTEAAGQGSDGQWRVKRGWRVTGAGMFNTTVNIDLPSGVSNDRLYFAFTSMANNSSNDSSGAVIENLTINCNHQNRPAGSTVACGAVKLC